MKRNILIAGTSLMLPGLLLLSACGNDKGKMDGMKDGKKETALEHALKHTDPKYTCPMHPNIITDKPGSCPICGMDLIKVKTDSAAPKTGKRKLLYYRHPHNPTIVSKTPRKDKMGMDYIPVYDTPASQTVKVPSHVIHTMGVRTAVASRSKLWRKINTVGFVELDEDKISHVHMRAKGWIQNLKVKTVGERVKKGQLLYEFYSPDLVNAQQEYVQALRSGNRSLISASRDKLEALAISKKQIEQIAKTRKVSQLVQVYASQDGMIAQLHAREGMFVQPAMKVMTLADLSSVWLHAEVFESQSDWVRVGQSASVQISYLPGVELEGKVDYIYPSLNQKTRTLRVRLRFENKDEKLKPNMYASVSIYGGARRGIIVIPRSALIRTGEENRVVLALKGGQFRTRKVVAGIESGNWVEIRAGLKEGEKVVTSGQFLIDSEASFKASAERMKPAARKPAGMKHEKVDKRIMGTGVIKNIGPDKHKLRMYHDPIPKIKWPSMTMGFRARPEVDLSKFKPEDKVEFELEKTPDGYVIKNMKVRK